MQRYDIKMPFQKNLSGGGKYPGSKGKRLNKRKIMLEIINITQSSGNVHDGTDLKNTRNDKLDVVGDFRQKMKNSQ